MLKFQSMDHDSPYLISPDKTGIPTFDFDEKNVKHAAMGPNQQDNQVHNWSSWRSLELWKPQLGLLSFQNKQQLITWKGSGRKTSTCTPIHIWMKSTIQIQASKQTISWCPLPPEASISTWPTTPIPSFLDTAINKSIIH